MTFAAACLWSLLRSMLIAAAGLTIAVPLRSTLQNATGRQAAALWTMALFPLFVPGLLIGYGYRNFALSLVHHPVWNELLYALLVMLQAVPVGALILTCTPPPPVSAAALHVRRLSSKPILSALDTLNTQLSTLHLVPDWLRHHLFAALPAAAAMFLLAFQESEIATLMQVRSWTEWLYTRFFLSFQVGATFRVLWLPVLVQLTVIAGALWVVLGAGAESGSLTQSIERRRVGWRVVTFSYFGLATTLLAIVPGAIVFKGTWSGFAVLQAHRTLIGEVGIALLMAVTAGVITWAVSGGLVRLQGRAGMIVMGMTVLPGLMGALALALVIAGLIQQEPLVSIRDTPLPLIAGEVAFLLPRALVLRLLIGRWRDSSAIHAAKLLAAANDRRRGSAAELLWHLDRGGWWAGLLMISYWAYLELTIPSLLAPPGMTPAPVVLYNLMHYGQISGLSAMLFATMAVPVVLILVGWWGIRGLASRE